MHSNQIRLILTAIMAAALLLRAQGGGAVDVLSAYPDLQGQVIELATQGDSFTALYRAGEPAGSRGGIVLLHDRNASPDAPEVMRPLRLGLAEAGWQTLAVQLPSAYDHEDGTAWRERHPGMQAQLAAAVAWLEEKGLAPRVVIAHGASDGVALAYAASGKGGELAAVVLVSSRLQPGGGDASRPDPVALDLPLLDVYGERDLAAVVEAATRRAAEARTAGNASYRQRSIPGALPGYPRLGDALVATVRAWLAAVTEPSGTP